MLPELADTLAQESGWSVATATLSGVGASTGSFSPAQWRADIDQVINTLGSERLSLAGFGLGGSLALRVAAENPSIQGVATFASPAHLARWVGDPTHFAPVLTRSGVLSASLSDDESSALIRDLLSWDPLAAAATIPPRRLLVIHGTDDHEVPVADAREIIDAAGGHGEIRIIQQAGHWLRADPRVVATLLGWLERHR
jgi:putative redox protein